MFLERPTLALSSRTGRALRLSVVKHRSSVDGNKRRRAFVPGLNLAASPVETLHQGQRLLRKAVPESPPPANVAQRLHNPSKSLTP